MSPTHALRTNVKDHQGRIRLPEGTQVMLVSADTMQRCPPEGYVWIKFPFKNSSAWIFRMVPRELLARLQ